MKIFIKKLFFVAFVVISFLSFINYANAQTVPARTPDPISGCTGFENTAQCRPEWTEALSNCVSGSLGVSGANTCEPTNINTRKMYPAVSVCTQTNITGPCRPERVNPYAAGTIARQAEIMGRQLGYTISCSSEELGFGNVGTDSNTNLDYYMNSICTVDSLGGVSAELLVNNYPNSWQTLATEIMSTKASIACGGIQYVFFNTDGTHRCLPRPTNSTTPACGLTATCGRPQVVIPNTNIANTTPRITNLTPSPSSTYNNNWYYRDLSYSSMDEEDQLASTQTIDPTAQCTGYETTANCHPEWNRATSICSASKMTGACRPQRVNPYAAASIAKRAVAIGKQKGYTTLCSARYVPFRPGIDPDTGLSYYYDIECSVNGTTGIDAEIMLSGSAWETQIDKTSTTGTNTTEVVTHTPTTNTTNTQTVTNSTRPSCSLTATCGTNNNTQTVTNSTRPSCGLTATCGTNNNTPNPPSTPTTIDVLSYMLKNNTSQGLSDGSITFHQIVSEKNIYLEKWLNANQIVHYSYDSSYIYMKDDSTALYPYTFRPGIWAKRFMRIGETVDMSANLIDEYETTCQPKTTGRAWPYKNMLEAHYPTYNAGGQLGIADVIVIKYDWAPLYPNTRVEREYYAKGYGIFKWEYWQDGLLNQVANLNTISNSAPISPNPTCFNLDGTLKNI